MSSSAPSLLLSPLGGLFPPVLMLGALLPQTVQLWGEWRGRISAFKSKASHSSPPWGKLQLSNPKPKQLSWEGKRKMLSFEDRQEWMEYRWGTLRSSLNDTESREAVFIVVAVIVVIIHC